MRAGHAGLVNPAQHPVTLADVRRLRSLEIVEGPEHGKEPLGNGGCLTQQMGRVDHHHRVELEPDRPRLDVADACQEEPRQQRAVRQPVLELGHGLIENLRARGLLDPPHDRLDLGPVADHLRPHLRLIGRGGGDRAEGIPGPQTCTQTERRGRLQELTARKSFAHQ